MRKIRVIISTAKRQEERWLTLAALSGNLEKLEAMFRGSIEVADPDLTTAEIAKLKANFPELKAFELPINPKKAADIKAVKNVLQSIDSAIDVDALGVNDIETVLINVDDVPELIKKMEDLGVEVKVGNTRTEPIKVDVILENQNTSEQKQPAKRGRKAKQ